MGARIAEITAELRAAGGITPGEIEQLLANVTGRNGAWLRAYGETALSDKMETTVREFAARRIAGEPLPYIVGSCGFHGHTFLVDNRVLVPRPETEHLVDEALVFLKDREYGRVLDVGTGSGAIACSILAENRTATAEALDVSADALLVAMANAHRLGVELRLSFFFGDVSLPVLRPFYDAIVANLPYVPTKDIARSPDPVSFEPRLALDGGPDGLDHYRRFVKHAPRLLAMDGLCLMEAAPPVISGLEWLACAAWPDAQVSVEADYGGRPRYVKVRTGALRE